MLFLTIGLVILVSVLVGAAGRRVARPDAQAVRRKSTAAGRGMR